MSHVTYKDIISHQNFKWSLKVKIVADAVEDISKENNLELNSRSFAKAFIEIYKKVRNKDKLLKYDEYLGKQVQLKPPTKKGKFV